MQRPKFVVADTMDLWLNIALPDLLKLLTRLDGFVLNDSEAHQLTKEDNVFAAIRKDSQARTEIRHHQERLARLDPVRARADFSSARRIRCSKVVDPTGAGDSFVGGMMGYLATARGSD